MKQRTSAGDDITIARLAVIEEKIETVISELASMKKLIPCSIIEHNERIEVLGRNLRSIQWFGGVIAVAIIGAFIGHILGI